METIVRELIAEHETTIQTYKEALLRLTEQPDRLETRGAFWETVKSYQQQIAHHETARDALREALRRATVQKPVRIPALAVVA
ncbi:MAG: hypothetical protein ACXWP0_01115 [Ktedonobacterales bacterium]